MARRRMIDPNIWGSEDMGKLTLRQRLLVIGLFSNADDHGKGKAKPSYVRSTIFPYDDIPIGEIIEDLQVIQVTISIEFYEVENNSYYKFVNWLKWQTVQKPQSSIIPDQVKNNSLPSPELFSPKGREEKGKEGEEKGSEETSALDDDHQRDRLRNLCNRMKIQGFGTYHLDIVYSYIGTAEIEVIEAAIKKSENKPHSYLTNTLHGMINVDKIIRAEQLPGARVGDNVVQFTEGIRQGFTNEHDRPYEEQPEWQLPAKYRDTAAPMPDVSGH